MQLHVLVYHETVRYVDSKERHVEVCLLRHAVRPWQSLSHAARCPAGRTAAVGLNTARTGCSNQCFRNDTDYRLTISLIAWRRPQANHAKNSAGARSRTPAGRPGFSFWQGK